MATGVLRATVLASVITTVRIWAMATTVRILTVATTVRILTVATTASEMYARIQTTAVAAEM